MQFLAGLIKYVGDKQLIDAGKAIKEAEQSKEVLTRVEKAKRYREQKDIKDKYLYKQE